MFEIGKTYWITVKSSTDEREFNIKAEVIEENAFMVKVKTNQGIEIIPFTRIKNVGNVRE